MTNNSLARALDAAQVVRGDNLWGLMRIGAADECWEWTGRKNGRAYGMFYQPTRRYVLAHRAAYALRIGAIPEGMAVCHRCDNPPCCNPNHLFLGSQAENLRDMRSKGRGPYQAVLTETVKAAIRNLVTSGRMEPQAVARMSGLPQITIRTIVGITPRSRARRRGGLLSPEQVIEIRAAYARIPASRRMPDGGQKEFAIRFGVPCYVIRDAAHGKTYRNVGEGMS